VKILILILQVERDYQVTIKDFELWKGGLKNNTKATFISYLKLNHLFMSGEGISDPKEYLTKGKIKPTVIDAIYNFVKK
jgi:hypothetical protein